MSVFGHYCRAKLGKCVTELHTYLDASTYHVNLMREKKHAPVHKNNHAYVTSDSFAVFYVLSECNEVGLKLIS
jgi:hypothetical protein